MPASGERGVPRKEAADFLRLPRETSRRWIVSLIARDLIEERDDGCVMRSAAIPQRTQTQALLSRNYAAVERLFAALHNLDLYRESRARQA